MLESATALSDLLKNEKSCRVAHGLKNNNKKNKSSLCHTRLKNYIYTYDCHPDLRMVHNIMTIGFRSVSFCTIGVGEGLEGRRLRDQ